MDRAELKRCIRGWELNLDKSDEDCDFLWKWYGTLTFRGAPSRSRARGLFYRWCTEMREVGAPSILNWIAVIEYSRFDGNRIRVLIGGSEVKSRQRWILRWQELSHGDAVLYRYRRSRFYKYVLREVPANRYCELAMDLCGWGIFDY
jgi:hypothetical protein